MKKYFGTDGIRGLVGSELINREMAYRLGQAMIFFCLENNLVPLVMVGHDTRSSSTDLVAAFQTGIKKAGGETILAGTISSPGLAFLTKHENVGLGLMITASHNPAVYNGFKIFDANGDKFDLEHEMRIEELIDQIEIDSENFSSKNNLSSDEIWRQKYENYLHQYFQDDDFLDLKVVVDCANGAAHEIAPNVLFRLVQNLSTINIFPNGQNINAACGSLHPEYLVEEVKKNGADLGIAFDGDCDRVILVDEKGEILNGDHILFVLAQLLQARGELQNNYVVSTVMSNHGFVQSIRGLGLSHHQTDVGDSVVAEAMKNLGANLGGEEAGHIIVLDHLSSGDGLLSALLVMRAMKHFQKPLSELTKDFQLLPKVLKNIEVKHKPELATIPELIETIAKLENSLVGQGRILVRYSGTEPKCRVMVEHHDAERAQEYVEIICEKIEELINN